MSPDVGHLIHSAKRPFMNALAEILRPMSVPANSSVDSGLAAVPVPQSTAWDPATFAQEQISSLVRRVFFPGWPKPSKQVVFTAVDANHDVAHICRRVGETLASQVPGTICLVDADARSSRLAAAFESFQPSLSALAGQCLKDRATRISPNLWFLPAAAFVPEREKEFSAAWLRHRLGDLRREFDYSVVHAPAVTSFSETGLLAHLADGVVLVLNAHRTRRVAAQHARDVLLAASARLIGAVLDQKQFPIPASVYRRL
jgi:Mrp family chromosome partitioning ATPase